MAEKKPVTIKVKEVSLENLTTLARQSSDGQRKATSKGAGCWAQTVLWLNSVKKLATFNDSQDVKEVAKDLREAFKTAFLEQYDDIPETGRNARTGSIMEVIDSSGQPKWSSWEETRLPINYCGDIAKVIKAKLVDDLIISDKEVMGKSDILKKAKIAEPAFKTCQRSLEMIEKKHEALSIPELKQILDDLTAKITLLENRKVLLNDAVK